MNGADGDFMDFNALQLKKRRMADGRSVPGRVFAVGGMEPQGFEPGVEKRNEVPLLINFALEQMRLRALGRQGRIGVVNRRGGNPQLPLFVPGNNAEQPQPIRRRGLLGRQDRFGRCAQQGYSSAGSYGVEDGVFKFSERRVGYVGRVKRFTVAYFDE
jgi:hypothetical protein